MTESVQPRIVGVLVTGQVLSGLGQGATLAIGAVIANDIGGEAFSGAAATSSTLGAAIAAIPLARLAQRLGRRIALTLGAATAGVGSIITVVATGLTMFPLLVLGFAMLGVGSAVGLQARFAATDVAEPSRRGRDLSLVVWSTTIGAVAGPNLFGPGVVIQDALALPDNTGSFVIAIVAQFLAAAVYFVALRPDPLFLARERSFVPAGVAIPDGVADSAPSGSGPAVSISADPDAVRARAALVFAVSAVAISHAVMVSIMSMTPVHLTHHGASLTVVGITISVHVAGMFALAPVFGWVSDRWGRLPTLLTGQAMLAASIIIIGLGAQSTLLVTVALVLLGLGWSAATVSGSALVSDLVTGEARVRIQGRADTIMSLAGAMGGAAAGPILSVMGYSGLAWVAGLLVLVVVSAAAVQRSRIPR
ncbi:MAG: MFS transporter [Rhodoglobus sp.]